MLQRGKLGIALIDPERSRRYWLAICGSSAYSVVARDSDARRDSMYVCMYVHTLYEKDISVVR